MLIKNICQLCKNRLELIGCYEKDFIAELCDYRHKKNMSNEDVDDENERLEDAKIMFEMLK